MKLHRNESGQMLIMTAIELVLLLGFLALAADVGVLFHTKRHMQTAVDAAATAAALNYYNTGLGLTASNQTDASAACYALVANSYGKSADCNNGMADGSYTMSDGTQYTVSEPPVDGYHRVDLYGNTASGYVEVVMSKPDPLYFFKVFTGNSTATVAARAVAGDPVGATGCVYTNALYLGGHSTITGPNSTNACGIYVNDYGTSVNSKDNGSVVRADFVYTPGYPSSKFNTQPTATQHVQSPTPSPYDNLYYPTLTDSGKNTLGGSSICGSGNTNTGTTYNTGASTDQALPSPATYTYSYSPSGGTPTTVTIPNVYCFSQNVTIGVKGGTTTFPTGFYVFEQGATLNGQVNFGLDGSTCYDPNSDNNASGANYGAVIYNLTGTFQQAGSTDTLAACAPTTGYYNSLGLIQPLTDTNNLELSFGNSTIGTSTCSISSASFNGWIYAPGASVLLHDQGGGVAVTGIVSNTIGLPKSPGLGNSGANGTLTMCNYNSVNNSTAPLRQIALVE